MSGAKITPSCARGKPVGKRGDEDEPVREETNSNAVGAGARLRMRMRTGHHSVLEPREAPRPYRRDVPRAPRGDVSQLPRTRAIRPAIRHGPVPRPAPEQRCPPAPTHRTRPWHGRARSRGVQQGPGDLRGGRARESASVRDPTGLQIRQTGCHRTVHRRVVDQDSRAVRSWAGCRRGPTRQREGPPPRWPWTARRRLRPRAHGECPGDGLEPRRPIRSPGAHRTAIQRPSSMPPHRPGSRPGWHQGDQAQR